MQAARRFILGRQGLWPGRRWKGLEGVAEAVQYIGGVQIDPLNVVGHSQDLALLSRVERYRPNLLEACLYHRRTMFEWGGTVVVRPVAELPYWRAPMLAKVREPRWISFARDHRSLILRVRRDIDREGPRSSRHYVGGAAVQSYRARKETGLALYYLWLRGDLMIRRRERGEKVYDLSVRLLPEKLLAPARERDSREHLALEGLRAFGLANPAEVAQILRRATSRLVPRQLRDDWSTGWERERKAIRVRVDGWPGEHWLLAEAEEELDAVAHGEVPPAWEPFRVSTEDEVSFVAPLDVVTARARAQRVFKFEYVWEVYKPASRRRWGYYVLPILYADTLRGRADLRMDRDAGTLRLLGFWWENLEDSRDIRFARAVGRGLIHLAEMNSASRVSIEAPMPRRFRSEVVRAAS